jgi:hypothetical protein
VREYDALFYLSEGTNFKIITVVFSFIVHCKFFNFWKIYPALCVPRTMLATSNWYNMPFLPCKCYIALVQVGVAVEVIYFLVKEAYN